MQLNTTTDYAIRVALYLATVRRAAGSAEICSCMGIPPGILGSVSSRLRKHGIVDTLRGTNGGYLLARQPEDISLRDIIVAMEGTTRINRCLEADGFCSRNGVPNCPVHKFYSRIQTKLDEAFQEMTVAALLADDLDEKLEAM